VNGERGRAGRLGMDGADWECGNVILHHGRCGWGEIEESQDRMGKLWMRDVELGMEGRGELN